MAEQLTLQQVLWKSGTVDFDQGLGRPVAAAVQGLNQDLLASAGIAGDEESGLVKGFSR